MTRVGTQRHKKKIFIYIYKYYIRSDSFIRAFKMREI